MVLRVETCYIYIHNIRTMCLQFDLIAFGLIIYSHGQGFPYCVVPFSKIGSHVKIVITQDKFLYLCIFFDWFAVNMTHSTMMQESNNNNPQINHIVQILQGVIISSTKGTQLHIQACNLLKNIGVLDLLDIHCIWAQQSSNRRPGN